MKRLMIRNGNLVQPQGETGQLDILVEDGRIAQIGKNLSADDVEEIDASGLTVVPGFIDIHAHLREPGQEYKEDIQSGTCAAVHGGYTAVACMPNTEPVNDDITITTFIQQRAKEVGHCRVYPVAAITKGLKGQELTEMGMLKDAGVVAFSDDGKPVADAGRMRLAMQYAKAFDAFLMQHCEVESLAAEGVMNEGATSVRIGLKGIPAASESILVARDIELCREYGAQIHFCHISTAASLKLIRDAKKEGLRVTCETAPHYFAADESWVESSEYDTNTKMNPPLRSQKDVEAVLEALVDGTIDAIATDHAPHHADEKNVEFNIALNGIVGLETAFSLACTHLLKTGVLDMKTLVERMSTRPAELLGVEGGVLKEGALADIVLVDPEAEVVYNEESLHSKSKNSPFLGQKLCGRVMATLVGGEQKI